MIGYAVFGVAVAVAAGLLFYWAAKRRLAVDPGADGVGSRSNPCSSLSGDA